MRSGAPAGAVILGVAAWLGLASPAAARPEPAAPDLRARVEQYVRARAPGSVTQIEIPELTDFALPGVAEGSVDVALSARRGQSFVGWVPVTVALRSQGRELKRGVVTVRVSAEERVLVATRSLRSGETLRGADLAYELRDLADVPDGGMKDPGQLVGRRVKRFVSAGDPVALDWTEPVPRIRRGQNVKLRLHRGPLRIETTGRARQDGFEGDWIRVVNTSSRRELLGRVGRDGVVHVEF